MELKDYSKRGYELIRDNLFEISDEQIEYHNKTVSDFVSKYLNDDNLDEWSKEYYSYINKLDNDNIKIYAEYGADKSGVKNINNFLRKLNLDKKEIRKNIEITKINRLTFTTPDKKLVITVSNKNFLNDGYFHYLGITGDYNSVYKFIYYFNKLGYNEDSCFGGRDYI